MSRLRDQQLPITFPVRIAHPNPATFRIPKRSTGPHLYADRALVAFVWAGNVHATAENYLRVFRYENISSSKEHRPECKNEK